MKTTFITFGMLLIFAACKKDRTCSCTSTEVSRTSTQPNYTYTAPPASSSTTTYKKIKKNNVNAQNCVNSESVDKYSYIVITGTTTNQYQMTVTTDRACDLSN
jgi:hypothetical protein